MKIPSVHKITKSLSGFLIVTILVGSCVFAPLTPVGTVQKAEALFGAGDAVFVVGGTGTIQETISAAANTVQAALSGSLNLKEFVLDPIGHALAKMILKSMTQSILTWINSGFQGSPAFITDLKQFMLDQADATVGQFIYNDPSLNFLCSPFQLDVKIALATTYQQDAHGGTDVQCTLSDVTDNVEGFLNGSFNEGGWDSWFAVTQNPVNTPTGALLEAKGDMYARIIDEQGRTVQELEWGKGFLSFKVCSDTQVAAGTQKDCSITTPGSVIADQINKSLGAGQDSLIAADEINEIIGALFAQLAQKAITGAAGLLGLGGNSQYSNNTYGSNGNQSYLDALKDEKVGSTQTGIGNPFEISIASGEKNTVLQNTIIDTINTSQTQLTNSQSGASSCETISMPSRLTVAREDAIREIIVSETVIAKLTELNDVYLSSEDPNIQLETIETYNQMMSAGLVRDEIENTRLQLYIENDLAEMVASLNQSIQRAEQNCRRSND